jgi:hypothetical protein
MGVIFSNTLQMIPLRYLMISGPLSESDRAKLNISSQEREYLQNSISRMDIPETIEQIRTLNLEDPYMTLAIAHIHSKTPVLFNRLIFESPERLKAVQQARNVFILDKLLHPNDIEIITKEYIDEIKSLFPN